MSTEKSASILLNTQHYNLYEKRLQVRRREPKSKNIN